MTEIDDSPATSSTRAVPRALRELPVLVFVALVLAFLLRTFVVQVFYIPSESMVPTLQVNDRMVVEKVTYQFREPVRGEIIVFAGDEPADDDRVGLADIATGIGQFIGVVPANAADFVKRVIGLPGDTILIEDGQLFVNGDLVEEPYVVNTDASSYGPVEVPGDSLFVMGDNRPGSSDSRSSMGYIPLANVVGRPAVIMWPPSRLSGIQTMPEG